MQISSSRYSPKVAVTSTYVNVLVLLWRHPYQFPRRQRPISFSLSLCDTVRKKSTWLLWCFKDCQCVLYGYISLCASACLFHSALLFMVQTSIMYGCMDACHKFGCYYIICNYILLLVLPPVSPSTYEWFCMLSVCPDVCFVACLFICMFVYKRNIVFLSSFPADSSSTSQYPFLSMSYNTRLDFQ